MCVELHNALHLSPRMELIVVVVVVLGFGFWVLDSKFGFWASELVGVVLVAVEVNRPPLSLANPSWCFRGRVERSWSCCWWKLMLLHLFCATTNAPSGHCAGRSANSLTGPRERRQAESSLRFGAFWCNRAHSRAAGQLLVAPVCLARSLVRYSSRADQLRAMSL